MAKNNILSNQWRLMFSEYIKLSQDIVKLYFLISYSLGGMLQVWELTNISPSLIRFFSITQLISDGFSLFFFFSIILVPFFLFIAVFKGSIQLAKVIFDSKTLLEDRELKKIFRTFLIFLWGLCILWISIDYSFKFNFFLDWFLDLKSILDSSSIDITVFLKNWLRFIIRSILVIIFFNFLLIASNSQMPHENKILKIIKTTLILPTFLIAYLAIVYFVIGFGKKLKAVSKEYLNPSILINTQELKNRLQKEYLDDSVNIEFYNDKYVFIKINEKVKVYELNVLLE